MSRDYLDGYRYMRSATSHGIWDLIAIGLKEIVPCQVKTGDWPGTADSDALETVRGAAEGAQVIHRSQVRRRQPKIRGI